jgi:hypothetical protein
VSRGYSLWEIEHTEAPLVSQPLVSELDKKVFLDKVRSVGAIATEPSVTELIELGASQHAGVIADVLFEAQERRYDATGILTCVSEGPLDRSPWFTYQGYELTSNGGNWSVHAVKDNPAWQTKEFAASARMVSSKAAYMWHACRKEPYAGRLQDFVRERAISDRLGFSAGVYEQTRKPANVFDVNTNGIILEALAFRRNNHRALIDLTPI